MANSRIIDVWADDLEAEMEHMREVIEKYPFVAMVSQPFSSGDLGVGGWLILDISGYRVPWCSSKTDGRIQNQLRLSLSDTEVRLYMLSSPARLAQVRIKV